MKLAISDVWKWAAKDKDGAWIFYGNRPSLDGTEWDETPFREVGSLISDFPECDWQDSLHRIVNGELVKHVELKVDDKVMVRDWDTSGWLKRHFSHFNSLGKIICFGDGCTSWSITSKEQLSGWCEWRLPTPEELA